MAKTFGNKLRELRDKLDMSQDDMAALLHTSKQVLSRYETGQRTPKLDTVQRYAEQLHVPLLYLVDNEVETLEEAEAIGESESVAYNVIGSIAAGYDHEAVYDYTNEIQLYPKSALRGRPKEDYFVLRVSGRSMEPLICDGDSALILRTDAVDQNTIAVVLYNGDEATLKKVRYTPQWLEMIPINPEFETKRIEGADLARCHILGKVVSLSRDII